MLNKQILSEKKENKNNNINKIKYVADFPGVSWSLPAANFRRTDIIFKARDNKALIKP